MVLGLKPMGKLTTYQNQVLDRTKVLHGPRTQTYGETNYLRKTLDCSDLQDDYLLKIGLRPRRNEGPNLSSDSQF